MADLPSTRLSELALEISCELEPTTRWRVAPGLVADVDAGLLRVLLTGVLLGAERAGAADVLVAQHGDGSFFVWADRDFEVSCPGTCRRIVRRYGGELGGDGTEVVRFRFGGTPAAVR
ncbi:MAG: hypothetical protein ACOZNI_00165 [Myxococcota bacterium]